MTLDEARARLAQRQPRGRARDRRLVRARRARRPHACAWPARSTGRCATSSPSGRRARRSSSPTASTRSTRSCSARAWTASSTRATRAWCRRTTSSRSRSSAAPTPTPTYTRFFTPERNALPAGPGRDRPRYVGALADEIAKWLATPFPNASPIGVCFSGGIDSGAVFLVVLPRDAAPRAVTRRGSRRSRCRSAAATDLAQARRVPRAARPGLFLEAIEAAPSAVDPFEAVRVLEDYKPLDVECAAMALALCRGIRAALSRVALPPRRRRRRREPQGLSDRGEPGADDPQRRRQPDALPGRLGRRADQALADLQRRPEPLATARTYAPLRRFGFEGFSPFTRPAVIEVAEAIPFAALTRRRHGAALRAQGRDRRAAASRR